MEDLRTPDRIDCLIEVIKEYNEIVDEMAIAREGQQLSIIQKVCNDFMNRTRINNEALIPMLTLYKDNTSLLLPIGLILRSILSDFLTSSYLITFHDAGDAQEQALRNELNILDRDFLRSMLKSMELEKSIHELNPDIAAMFADDAAYQAKKTSIQSKFPYLFKQENISLRLLDVKELRATSDKDKFFSTPQEFATVGSGFMSEEYKFDRIKQRGFAKYSTAFISFKYFSQFQHYSKLGFKILDEEFEGFGYFHLVASINIMLISTWFQIMILEGQQNEFAQRINALIPKLDGALGAE